MKINTADITVVLDRSGSMVSCLEETLGGFNTFLEDQKKTGIDTTFTLVQFDNQYQIDYSGICVELALPLTKETYIPRGMTALHDAIGRTIVTNGERFSKMKEEDRPEKVVFVILTDGVENASSDYDASKIKELITEQSEKYNWQFLYIGANQDAITTGAGMGVAAQNTLQYASNAIGTQNAFASASSNTRSYTSGQTQDASFNQSDRDLQSKAGA